MFKFANNTILNLFRAKPKDIFDQLAEDLESDKRRTARMVVDRLAGQRQTGRTTRIIDEAIQTLFAQGEVTVVDHHHGATSSMRALDILMKRLDKEHYGVSVIKTGPHSVKLKHFSK